MQPNSIIWDLEDDPDGNVQHIAEHGLTIEDVEDVLLAGELEVDFSRATGNPMTFGYTSDGRYIAVIWEHIDDYPYTIRPITAYEVDE